MNTPPVRRLMLAWLALLALLALSCGSAFLHLGVLNPLANYGIAVAKACIVITVFMHLTREAPLLRVVAAAAMVALALLVGLSATDFLARGG